MSLMIFNFIILGVKLVRHDSAREMTALKTSLRDAFSKVKEEFDEHLQSINENTNEIQANYEYLCRLDAKIDKLAERVDELCMHISPQQSAREYSVGTLTIREKEVFFALYSANEPLGYKDLARRTGLSEELVLCYVTNLVNKGVPIVRQYIDSVVRLHLDAQFRERQAKENIVGLNGSLAHGCVKSHILG